jgi:phage terminase small subunit
MPGPTKKPRGLKIIAGTDQPARRDAIDPPQFEPVREFPPAPQHLTTDGAELWNELGPQLVACGVLQIVDLYALEQLCYAWQRFRKKAKADMEVTASEDNALKALWQEFGLTPAARRRVVASVSDGKPANRFAAHGKRPA